MSTFFGRHVQARTGRCIRYRVEHAPSSDGDVYFAVTLSEHAKYFPAALGHFEGQVSGRPDRVPPELAIRSAVMSYIDRTNIPEPKDPDPTFIGWYGPY